MGVRICVVVMAVGARRPSRLEGSTPDLSTAAPPTDTLKDRAGSASTGL
jgi:hypothetical protein